MLAADGDGYLIAPNATGNGVTRQILGTDHEGNTQTIRVIEERPLTIYLNSQEIVTAMTIGDYPEYLAVGFLRNQGMLNPSEAITGISYDDELETIVVRTETQTNYEEKLKKKTRTSGCAVGTVFGDMMEGLEGLKLPTQSVKTSWLYMLASRINRTPSLYLEAGAIHGTVLCEQDRPLVYMEDVGTSTMSICPRYRHHDHMPTVPAPCAYAKGTGTMSIRSRCQHHDHMLTVPTP